MGYSKIAKGWSNFCDSAIFLKKTKWIEGSFEDAAADMAWVAGQIVLTVEVRQQQFSVQFRSSFVLRQNTESQWKIKHEHVSGPLEDPYGIGDWLKKTA